MAVATFGTSAPLSMMIEAGLMAGAMDAGLQEVAVGVGLLNHFSVADVIEAGFGAVLSVGYGQVLAGLGKASMSAGNIGKIAAAYGALNVSEQLTEMALGIRKQSSFRDVLLSIGAGVLNAEIPDVINVNTTQAPHIVALAVNNAARTLYNGVFSSMILGTPLQLESMAAQMIGSTLGQEAASYLLKGELQKLGQAVSPQAPIDQVHHLHRPVKVNSSHYIDALLHANQDRILKGWMNGEAGNAAEATVQQRVRTSALHRPSGNVGHAGPGLFGPGSRMIQNATAKETPHVPEVKTVKSNWLGTAERYLDGGMKGVGDAINRISGLSRLAGTVMYDVGHPGQGLSDLETLGSHMLPALQYGWQALKWGAAHPVQAFVDYRENAIHRVVGYQQFWNQLSGPQDFRLATGMLTGGAVMLGSEGLRVGALSEPGMLALNRASVFGGRAVGAEASGVRLLRTGPKSSVLNEGTAPITNDLVNAMRSKGRTIDVAVKGSDDFRYLKSLGAEGSINTGVPNHILIREDASKSTLMEEFLHGTQAKLGIVDRLTAQGAEVHVKDFMIRHSSMLGLDNPADLNLLEQLKIEEIERFDFMQQRGTL